MNFILQIIPYITWYYIIYLFSIFSDLVECSGQNSSSVCTYRSSVQSHWTVEMVCLNFCELIKLLKSMRLYNNQMPESVKHGWSLLPKTLNIPRMLNYQTLYFWNENFQEGSDRRISWPHLFHRSRRGSESLSSTTPCSIFRWRRERYNNAYFQLIFYSRMLVSCKNSICVRQFEISYCSRNWSYFSLAL